MESIKNIISAGQLGRKQFVSEAPIVARAIESIPGPSWLRTGLGVTTDFALDPLTYVSFGAGGAIRGAAGRAAREAERRAASALPPRWRPERRPRGSRPVDPPKRPASRLPGASRPACWPGVACGRRKRSSSPTSAANHSAPPAAKGLAATFTASAES